MIICNQIAKVIGYFRPFESLTFGSLPFFLDHISIIHSQYKNEKLTLIHFSIKNMAGKKEIIKGFGLSWPFTKMFSKTKWDCDLNRRSRKLYFVYIFDPKILVFPDYCQHWRKYVCLLFQNFQNWSLLWHLTDLQVYLNVLTCANIL